MKVAFGSKSRPQAQTLVFFLVAWGTIMLLCGLAIDSGLLFLSKARLSRAVDGAALAAVGNFNRSSVPTTNRDDVALIMRNFAVANFTDLAAISTNGSGTSGGTPSTYIETNGTTGTSYTYNFNDGTQDANGAYRRYVQVVLNTGSGGAITSATCTARCPVQTYFIGYATYAIGGRQNVKIGGYSGPSSLVDLKVSSTAVATRNPRLIMVVIDRSASMLFAGGGASGLPPAVVQFLDFFDTSSDNIGIVSFGSTARLEMPLTTNFIVAGTNNLIDAYNTNDQSWLGAIPGIDPEDTNSTIFATNGSVRRLKFGGQTAADEGIRMAMEQMMANSGFNDPDVVKYLVVFTDGKWNSTRTLFAAPGYTNTLIAPLADAHHVYQYYNYNSQHMTNGQYTGGPSGGGPWNATNMADNTNLMVMPSMATGSAFSIYQDYTNVVTLPNTNFTPDFTIFQTLLSNQTWQSVDSSGYEPLQNPTTTPMDGAPMNVTNYTLVGTNAVTGVGYYTTNVDIWLPPGSVVYYSPSSLLPTHSIVLPAQVSDYTDPGRDVNCILTPGAQLDLVVPGYCVDGCFFDGLDLPYSYPEDGNWPRYRCNNFQEAFMWPDDPQGITNEGVYASPSKMRQLMFRNYPNLLTGFYVFRPDDPLSSATEPLDDTTPATYRPLYGLGPYYPSAGFYWPFDLVGVDYGPNYGLVDPLSDPDPDDDQSYMGGGRHVAYSINMSSTAAAPEWAGELFYRSISGGGSTVYSGNGSTSASTIMSAGDWKTGAPNWLSSTIFSAGIMTSDAEHNSNISSSSSVYRPATFTGSSANLLGTGLASVLWGDPLNLTGGYVQDGQGHYYRNTMAWSGRPTHYYDMSQSKWVSVANNHVTNIQALPLGNWKAREYCWHARALGVTIYTVGYGTLVSDDEQAFLAQLANATNTTAGGGSNITYNPSQPIGQQFYATNATDISNDFYSVGQAINAALTQ